MLRKFFLLLILGSFFACKKEKNNANGCPNSNDSISNLSSPNLFDSTGHAFFNMQKFYSYKGSNYSLDSSKNYAYNNGSWSWYGRWNPIGVFGFRMDSAKVNGVKFNKYNAYLAAYSDGTNSFFEPPRTYQLFGDSLQNIMYLNSYTDNTLLPTYNLNGCNLPDSASINSDLTLKLQNRTNARQTCVSLLTNVGGWQSNLSTVFLSNNNFDNKALFKKEQLQNWPLGIGNYYLVVTLLNWSKTTFRGKSIYFVSEHRYSKKIKLYN